MRTAISDPPDKISDFHQRVLKNIGESGWYGLGVGKSETGPGFVYSTGFWLTLGHPEIIVFSLPTKTAHAVMWDIFRDIQSGNPPPIGQATQNIFGSTSAALLPAAYESAKEYLLCSDWFYRGEEFPSVQLVWPDKEGVFPWDANFDKAFEHDQPDLSKTGWPAMRTR